MRLLVVWVHITISLVPDAQTSASVFAPPMGQPFIDVGVEEFGVPSNHEITTVRTSSPIWLLSNETLSRIPPD